MAPRRSLALSLLLAVSIATPVRVASGDELPARTHALLLLRVLAYDRNLRERSGATLTVVVLHRPGDHASERRSATLRAAFEEVARDLRIAGLPVQVREEAFRGAAELQARLDELRPALLEIDDAVAPALPEVVQLTRQRDVTSAGTRAMAQAGAAVGVSLRDGRAGLTINLPGARAEGADLEAALLGLCEVISQ